MGENGLLAPHRVGRNQEKTRAAGCLKTLPHYRTETIPSFPSVLIRE